MMGLFQNLTAKVALAFFLVFVAAAMVFIWMLKPPTADANALALLAGFVTLFIKMAADATGYQFTSSAGSEKKDEVQAVVAGKLADKVAPAAPVPAATAAAVAVWWGKLTDDEKNTITTAGATDPRVLSFVSASTSGTATDDDLAYLVNKGLLTQARADEIKAAKV